jgi:hypothetical protein
MWGKVAPRAGLYEFADEFRAWFAQRIELEGVYPDGEKREMSRQEPAGVGRETEVRVWGRRQYPTQRND